MLKHEEWLFKAEQDLESAKALLDLNLRDTAIYHSQQCPEKAFKAYLVYKNQPLIKSHNLDVMCQICINLDNDFDNIYLDAIDLNGLDIIFRYPGIKLLPLKTDVESAIKAAARIFIFVKNKCADY